MMNDQGGGICRVLKCELNPKNPPALTVRQKWRLRLLKRHLESEVSEFNANWTGSPDQADISLGSENKVLSAQMNELGHYVTYKFNVYESEAALDRAKEAAKRDKIHYGRMCKGVFMLMMLGLVSYGVYNVVDFELGLHQLHVLSIKIGFVASVVCLGALVAYAVRSWIEAGDQVHALNIVVSNQRCLAMQANLARDVQRCLNLQENRGNFSKTGASSPRLGSSGELE